MIEIPEFLFSEDRLHDDGFQRYVYHTRAPRALFRMENEGEEELSFELIDELDKFDQYPPQEIVEMYERLKSWWAVYRTEFLSDELPEDGTVEVKLPDLDDVLLQTLTSDAPIPDPAEFSTLDHNTQIKVAINGTEFWAGVVQVDYSTQSIYAIVESDLDEKELKTDDPFMARFTNVLEIRRFDEDEE